MLVAFLPTLAWCMVLVVGGACCDAVRMLRGRYVTLAPVNFLSPPSNVHSTQPVVLPCRDHQSLVYCRACVWLACRISTESQIPE